MSRKLSWEKMISLEVEQELQKMGALVADARKLRRISLLEIANRVGVDPRTVSQLEKGSPTVSLGIFFQILSTLNLMRGISEALKPENDIEAISLNIKRIRNRKILQKKIPSQKVDF